MKKSFLFLLSLSLISCSNAGDVSGTSGNNKKQNSTSSVYLDCSEISTSNFRIKTKSADASGSSENHSLEIIINIKNLSKASQRMSFNNLTLVRESTNLKYNITLGYRLYETLDSEIEGDFYFRSTIPSTLEERYYFSFELQNLTYKVFLYEMPDELREDLTVKYMIGNEEVHVENVKKGRTLQISYMYDYPDHQSYCKSWKDSAGNFYNKGTKIEESVVLNGTGSLPNINYLTSGVDLYSFVNRIDHVHADGKVVIPGTHDGKEICLANYAIYYNNEIKEVYLPLTLHHIYGGNFTKCGSLKTIYFAGTREQWQAIPMDYVTIPVTVNIVYNTSFNF